MQVIEGRSIEAVLAEWIPVIRKMANKVHIPNMAADDIEQELLLTFTMAWTTFEPKQEKPFSHYLRVCLKYKITSLMRYAYVEGRKGTYTFTDLFGDDDRAEDKLDKLFYAIRDVLSVYEVRDWKQTLLDEAAIMSTAHVRAILMFIARVTAEDIAVASQTPSVLFTSLIAEVLEGVRRKYFKEITMSKGE